MSDVKEKTSVSEKLNRFLEKNRIVLFSVLGALVVAVIAYAVIVTVSAKETEKNLSVIDEISYALTNGAEGLEESELAGRRSTAMESVTPLLKKGGVVGVRANMLAADVAYQNKDYAASLDYWKAAAEKGKKSYTAPLAYYNVGVCAEQTGDLAVAAENFKKAADVSDFVLKSHAQFSLGRVYEKQNDYAKAVEAYNVLINASPDESWAKMAKTRVLDMKIKGNIQ